MTTYGHVKLEESSKNNEPSNGLKRTLHPSNNNNRRICGDDDNNGVFVKTNSTKHV